MNRHLLSAGWAITLTTAILLRVEFTGIAAWSFDQAGLLWQAVLLTVDGVFPATGIVSSTGALSFNTSTLVTALACSVAGGVRETAIVLSCLQIPILVLLVRGVPAITPGQRLLVTAAVLFNPWLIGIGVDNWPQFLSLNWVCLLFLLAWRFIDNKAGSWTWFCLGLLLPFTVTAYLGNAALAAVLGLLVAWILARNRVEFGWRRLMQLAAGGLIGALVFLVPYFVQVWETDALDLLMNQTYGSNPRNLDNFLRTLTHPWRLLFDPRTFFWYTQEVLLNDSARGAASIHVIKGLHVIAAALGLWALSRRSPDHRDPLSHPHLILVIGTWGAVILLYFFLPSTVFVTDHKGAAWYGVGLTGLYAGALAGAIRLGHARFGELFLALAAVIGACTALDIVRDNHAYAGDHIPFVDAPLSDRLAAAAWIGGQHRTGSRLGIGYHFSWGNRTALEREYDYYASHYEDGALVPGRLFDAELLLKFDLRNSNGRRTDRYLGDNTYLVTYSTIPPEKLPAPWTGGTAIHADFGRIRVWKR